MSRFVSAVLESDWLWHLCRIVITFMFWFAGLGFLADFGEARTTMAMTGLEPQSLVAALTILVLLVGSALIIVDRWVWFGAGMLGVFTVLTIILVHDFWNMAGGEAVAARLEAEEHITVIGGLIAVSILSHVRRQWKAALLGRGSR